MRSHLDVFTEMPVRAWGEGVCLVPWTLRPDFRRKVRSRGVNLVIIKLWGEYEDGHDENGCQR